MAPNLSRGKLTTGVLERKKKRGERERERDAFMVTLLIVRAASGRLDNGRRLGGGAFAGCIHFPRPRRPALRRILSPTPG